MTVINNLLHTIRMHTVFVDLTSLPIMYKTCKLYSWTSITRDRLTIEVDLDGYRLHSSRRHSQLYFLYVQYVQYSTVQRASIVASILHERVTRSTRLDKHTRIESRRTDELRHGFRFLFIVCVRPARFLGFFQDQTLGGPRMNAR
jgi:hypothetical protein